MTKAADTLPVVVGVDGSDAALAAALWAVDEAVDREAPLRLVHAIGGAARDHSIPFDTSIDRKSGTEREHCGPRPRLSRPPVRP